MARTKEDERKEEAGGIFDTIGKGINNVRDGIADFIHSNGEEVEDSVRNTGRAGGGNHQASSNESARTERSDTRRS